MKFESEIKAQADFNNWSFKPVTEVHSDFEGALIIASMYVYSLLLAGTELEVRIYGCYFHLMQAM